MMVYCGVLGPGFASSVLSIRGKDKKGKDTWVNWKTCKYLEAKVSETKLGKTVYPCCSKGFVVERVAGSSLGRLLRGKPMKCPEFDEITSLVKPKIIDHEILEALGFDPLEQEIIAGPKFTLGTGLGR